MVAWNLFCQKTESFSFAGNMLLWRKYLVRRDTREICQENLVVKIIYLFNIERKKLYIYTFAKLQLSCMSSYLFPCCSWLTSLPSCDCAPKSKVRKHTFVPWEYGHLDRISPISPIDIICAKIQCVKSYSIKLYFVPEIRCCNLKYD